MNSLDGSNDDGVYTPGFIFKILIEYPPYFYSPTPSDFRQCIPFSYEDKRVDNKAKTQKNDYMPAYLWKSNQILESGYIKFICVSFKCKLK